MTIREHLNAAYILSANMCAEAEKDFKGPGNVCPGCDVAKEIEAALALLDAAERAPFDNTHPDYCCLRDPEPVASRNAP